MILHSVITRGLAYLCRVRNTDGGVPATKPGTDSGCWTSAESLEALLTSHYHDADPRPCAYAVIDFLLATSLQDGGWPAVASGKRSSTMATGNAVAALLIAQAFFSEDSTLQLRIRSPIETGLRWLVDRQNDDGGWGVEPDGGPDGAVSRVISTLFALKPYWAQGVVAARSQAVRNAMGFLLRLRNADGGFAGRVGSVSDPCNTARVIVGLVRSGYREEAARAIAGGLRYIERSRPRGRLWALDRESYVPQGAAGQTIFNNNTTVDVLEALIRAGRLNRHTRDLVQWFLAHQEDDGSWFLGANDQRVHDVVTWSTNEAVLVLALAADALGMEVGIRQNTRNRVLFVTVCALLAVQSLILFGVPMALVSWWSDLPEGVRSLVVQNVALGVGASLIAAVIYDRLIRRQ